jgi:hypothetical protein
MRSLVGRQTITTVGVVEPLKVRGKTGRTTTTRIYEEDMRKSNERQEREGHNDAETRGT